MDKNGNNAVLPEGPSLGVASVSGEGVAYDSYEALGGATGSTVFSEHISTRTKEGWSTSEVTPSKTTAAPSDDYQVEYPAFSPDLSEFVVEAPDQALAAGATPGAENLFLRHADGEYTLINAATPEEAPPAECSGECFEAGLDEVEYAGASTDFEHILFISNAVYGPETPVERYKAKKNGFSFNGNESESLYENFDGQVQLVSYLPDETPVEATAGSGRRARSEDAISSDGKRIVFDAESDEGTAQEGGQEEDTEVYDRINGDKTIELSGPVAGATPTSSAAGESEFWAASANGSRVFFTSEQQLTTNSTANAGEPDLYEYEFASEDATEGTLEDLTVDASSGQHADVIGVVDASENGEYVYFVATGELAAGATSGEPNLYMVHGGAAPVFIAKLNAEDDRDWAHFGTELEAYVTPDGTHVAFMSIEPLVTNNFPSGYDNTDQTTNKPDSEVYEYSAPTAAEEAAGEAGILTCGSCNSSEAQPTGDSYIGGVSTTTTGSLAFASNEFHHVRALSENGGRLFFSSPPIASENVSAEESPSLKVYEREADGEGTCSAASGCTFLISEPMNEQDDYFLDASPTGSNVFFSTLSKLAPADEDELRDVYDAREDGGFPTLAPLVECQSACRTQGGSVTAGPPLTSGLVGPPENVAPKKAGKPAKKHGTTKATKAKKLKAALKKCNTDRKKARRSKCEARARKQYGAKAKRKGKSKKSASSKGSKS